MVPDRRSTGSWAHQTKATLFINRGTQDEHKLTLPVQVARLLDKKKRSGEIHPSSQADLFFVVDELCRSSARLRVERLINRREYSELEVRQKLKQDGYTQEVIDSCMQRACDIGLVSNARYADSFIRSKLYAGWGSSRIVRELSQKGIDIYQVPGWPEEYLEGTSELQRAIQLARSRHVTGPKAFEKLVRFLCARGYRTNIAIEAARAVAQTPEQESLVDF